MIQTECMAGCSDSFKKDSEKVSPGLTARLHLDVHNWFEVCLGTFVGLFSTVAILLILA